MKYVFLLALLLVGCLHTQKLPPTEDPPPLEQEGVVKLELPDQAEDSLALEQVPSEISIEHFSRMRLEGTDFTIGEVLRQTDAYTRYAITYRSNGLLISGILNLPHGEGPFPLVVTNHGYIDRHVYTRGRGLKREQDFLARHGFTVLHPDYRGHAFSDPSPLPDDSAIYDAGLEYSMDVLNSIRALQRLNHPKIDTDRVAMLGHSLGGGVALNIAVAYPDVIDALVLYAPVHSDAWENFARWRAKRKEGTLTIETIGTRESDPVFWDAISASAYLDNIETPVLLFQGTQDSDVPKEWSDFLAERFDALGKEVTYVVYEGEKHEFIPRFRDFMEQSTTFFQEHLPTPQGHDAAKRDGTPSFEDADTAAIPLYDVRRITKKPFGLFVTPDTSPVSPERFSGYHTGVDFEASEDEALTVTTLCSGEVLFVSWVRGYGGTFVQQCRFEGEDVTVLYGHLDIDSIPYQIGDIVDRSEVIGHLGRGYSQETDGERPHLHLAIHRGREIEFRGYVQSKAALSEWMDPREVLL